MRLYAPPVEYAAARASIRDLDVIAFEGRGPVSAGIRLVTGGSVTHVGLAAWWGDRLMLVESRELRGGRAVLLSGEIPSWGVLHLRPRHPLAAGPAQDALRWAIGGCGAAYSYTGVLRFLRRLGLPLRPPAEDRVSRGARFCSEFVGAAYRVAGVDLRPDLVDAATSPAELAASHELELVARVVPDAESIPDAMQRGLLSVNDVRRMEGRARG